MGPSSPAIELREAQSAEELHAIFRFRYQIYVEEMQRQQHYANHDARIIQDPLDEEGCNIAAWKGDHIVGVVRINPFSDPSTNGYRELYGLTGREDFSPPTTALVTRLMTASGKRSMILSSALATACYRHGINTGIKHCYIDCNAHLVSWFCRLGFLAFGEAQHHEYGEVTILSLDLRNDAHLENVRSPFLKYLRSYQFQ